MKKILLISILLLFLVELFSWFFLRSTQEEQSLFFQSKYKQNKFTKLNSLQYNELHPLYGWKMKDSDAQKKGYTLEYGHIVLSNETASCEQTFVVYVSGGSTSDLMYDENNWPVQLFEKLKENHGCVKMYIGAIGGHNSGQELLRLLEVLPLLNINLHISYSGANEYLRPNMVSDFENNLFQNQILKTSSPILPNVVFLIQKKILNQKQIALNAESYFSANEFWLQNMETMEALAQYNQYEFMGILQPVSGFSGYSLNQNDLKNSDVNLLEEYATFYPKLIDTLPSFSFLYNETQVFSAAQQNPFKDDCHLSLEENQNFIANKIYEIVKNQYYLDTLK
jgi:hypothetical protein